MLRRTALFLCGGALSSCALLRVPPPEYDPVALASGVTYQDVVVPEAGQPARFGDAVAIHYRLTLNDGTPVDSSYDRGVPFEMVLGASAPLPGLQEGIVGMRLYGRRRISVPPELGYGEEGLPPSIPGNAILRADVELMRHEPAEEDAPAPSDPPAEPNGTSET